MYQIYQSRLEPSHWASGVVNVSTSDQFHQVSLVSLVKIPAPPGSQNFNLYESGYLMVKFGAPLFETRSICHFGLSGQDGVSLVAKFETNVCSTLWW